VLFTGHLLSVVVDSICSTLDSAGVGKPDICSDGKLSGVLRGTEGPSLMELDAGMVEVRVRIVRG
jgi:hypothetical protein